MNNLRKRILSLFLSGVMTLSMAAPFTVYAEDVADGVESAVAVQEQGASSDVQNETNVPDSASQRRSVGRSRE